MVERIVTVILENEDSLLDYPQSSFPYDSCSNNPQRCLRKYNKFTKNNI